MQVMADKTHRRVVVLGTGGTIAGLATTAYDNIGYTAAQVGVAQLMEAIQVPPEFGFELVTEQVAQVDSKDMSFAVWQRLARRCQQLLEPSDVQGIVVTHGTDTMEETAYFLHAVLSGTGNLTKPVVLTGAMRPASSLMPDGPQNMLDALTVATHPGAAGVMVVFAGAVHSATEVQKVHTYRLDAFDSGDAGPLAYVEEGVVRMVRNGPSEKAATAGFTVPSEGARWPRVEIIMNYAGAGPLMVDSLLFHGLGSDDPLRGIVVAATGNGSVHQDLEAALLRARASGVSVVRATRCTRGRVLPGNTETLPDSAGLSAVKARIAMMLTLMQPATTTRQRPAPGPAP